MRRLSRIIQIIRFFGLFWLIYRFIYAIQLRLGWFRWVTPGRAWDPIEPPPSREAFWEARPPFFFDVQNRSAYVPYLERFDLEADESASTAVDIANRLQQGKLRYYSHVWVDVGLPPAWHKNPFSGQTTPTDRHWSDISDFGQGDIKNIWEPSRFSVTYALVRAYWRTGDESYPALFWSLVEDWRLHNPPNLGANWKCGQETTFRVMAWCFGLYGFRDSSASSAERHEMLRQMILVSGERIEHNLRYAISQANNHGVSESAGLWMIGALFPEAERASLWKRIGQRALERQAERLFDPDGGFSQHSFNYHRVALHDYLWVLRLATILDEPFSAGLRERLEKSLTFLVQFQIGEGGQLPNFGQNDGAYILPLNNCAYRDYRPLIQALSMLLHHERYYPSGPWDEDVLWLFGLEGVDHPISEVSSPSPRVFIAPESGCSLLSLQGSDAFIRCGRYRHRPSHADMLHVDLWWKGVNVALDPGTYSYNDPEPWGNPLAKSKYHNTVTLNGADQMDRVSRFMWLPWREGHIVEGTVQDDGVFWEGEMVFKGGVKWHRSVIGSDEGWVILDQLDGRFDGPPILHWHLEDFPLEQTEEGDLLFKTPVGDIRMRVLSDAPINLQLTRAADASPDGWQAPNYHEKTPLHKIDVISVVDDVSSVMFGSYFAPADAFDADFELADGVRQRQSRLAPHSR